MILGIISDTHGLLRPEAVEFLRGSEHIIHAGDIGSPEIVPELEKIAPVTAIRGNVDVQGWARRFSETEVVELAGRQLYVIHDVNAMDLNPRAAGFAAVISGHSHQPKKEVKDGVLYFNPGSAGPRRFSLPVSLGRLVVGPEGITASLHRLTIATART
ncbi:MAG TPA: metallophosphoesterase family protein [Candidatus Angelobacter sp.]|nr:metallophosphoesterase family protein [Candidatus Angelobacter sp.]